MNIDTLKIVQKANKIVAMCGTRDPNCIAICQRIRYNTFGFVYLCDNRFR